MASGTTIPSSRDGFREAIEQVCGIVRTGCRLGVVLHTEGRSVHELESLDVVVQAHVETRAGPKGLSNSSPSGACTANPWLCAVISTLPVVRSFTGWLMPR